MPSLLSVSVACSQVVPPCIRTVFPFHGHLNAGTFTPRGLAASSLDRFLSHCRTAIWTPPVTSHAHTRLSRTILHARIAPLPLFDSMLSETPGARNPLSFIAVLRVACAQVKTIGSHPNFPVLGAMCQIQGIHPSPRRTPTLAVVPGGWIYLTRRGFRFAHLLSLLPPPQQWLRAWLTDPTGGGERLAQTSSLAAQ